MKDRSRDGRPRFADEPILPACAPTVLGFVGFGLTALGFMLYAFRLPYELVMIVALASLVAAAMMADD